MNGRRVCQRHLVTALVALGAGLGLNKAATAPSGQPPAEEGVQVLTRGPVHEAFAETFAFDPQPGLVVPREPPAVIEELPPEQRLEGADVTWIPGYWAWDDERSDFLWVSGIWRNLPPDRQWVPGYWAHSGRGFQWTSGYWADARMSEAEYLPEPPETVEAGPNIGAPSADSSWLPGCWVWQQSRYAWRPGFWATLQPDWVWVPAHYVWAPRGYVFVDGYWDHSVGRRGLLFAPVYFHADVYARRGFSYSPTTVIDLGALINHLFLRPRYHHYYFGDYYDRNYQAAGFYPAYSYSYSHSQSSGRYGYDPIYAHQRWRHRQDSGWERRVAAEFRNRRDHEDARPLRTWAAQQMLRTNEAASRDRRPGVAASLQQLTKSKDSRLRLAPLDAAERQKLAQQAQRVQRLREERRKLETEAVARPAERPSREVVPARVRLPGSPIVAKPVVELGKDRAPPKIYQAPQPDPKVTPKPRGNRVPPRVDQPRPTLQPRPQAERDVPKPQHQPKADRDGPKTRNKPAAPPRGAAGPSSPGPKKDKDKDKDNGKAK